MWFTVWCGLRPRTLNHHRHTIISATFSGRSLVLTRLGQSTTKNMNYRIFFKFRLSRVRAAFFSERVVNVWNSLPDSDAISVHFQS